MKLEKCPRCGEMYSASYHKCPFCEEEEYMRRVGNSSRLRVRSGARMNTHISLAVLLALALVIVSWYLLGDKLVLPIAQQSPAQEERLDSTPTDPAAEGQSLPVGDPALSDPGYVPVDPAQEGYIPQDAPVSEPEPVYYDVSGASLNKGDITIARNETFQLKLRGTDAPASWSSDNPDCVAVDASGLVTGVSSGNATVYATVGDRTLSCIVRVKR